LTISIETLKCPSVAESHIEVVERKGLGHPDTICDLLCEELSRALASYYLDNFGSVLHHNVDKSLLVGGRSLPAFAGGQVLQPMDLFLSGRATTSVQGKQIPLSDIAKGVVEQWVRRNLHAVDPTLHIRVHDMVRPGSADLVDVFARNRNHKVPLANDTSCGTGFAPLTELERVVLAVEHQLNHPKFKGMHPESGEDIKVMGVRRRDRIGLTISCAFIGQHLSDLDAYASARHALADAAVRAALEVTQIPVAARINTADDLARGLVFLTVTGTSAESGDDGQTGRGNRANGLITPFRPMTMEAVAGKNPISHVGKLYNTAASRLAAAIVANVGEISEAQCHLLSEIGTPIDEPQLALIRVRTPDSGLARETERRIRDLAIEEIRSIREMWKLFMSGEITIA
jgi:S-adenosylmethionine synthetase